MQHAHMPVKRPTCGVHICACRGSRRGFPAAASVSTKGVLGSSDDPGGRSGRGCKAVSFAHAIGQFQHAPGMQCHALYTACSVYPKSVLLTLACAPLGQIWRRSNLWWRRHSAAFLGQWVSIANSVCGEGSRALPRARARQHRWHSTILDPIHDRLIVATSRRSKTGINQSSVC